MSYAHKLATCNDDPYKPVVFCSVCGHEDNLSGPCDGPDKNQFTIDAALKEGFRKIFGERTKYELTTK